MTAVVSPSEVTMELPVPPAVDQWRAEQGLPPLPELECDRLFYDQFGVIRPRKRPSFRRHAARHTAAT